MHSKEIQSLVKKGYFRFKLKKKNFHIIQKILISSVKKKIINKKLDLEKFHKLLNVSKLNKLRMNVFKEINKSEKFKKNTFLSAAKYIDKCVGTEICCSDINLSIQYPKDETSLLEMHTDFFSSESLFQINLWIPFSKVSKTQSMFIIDPKSSVNILKKIKLDKKITFQSLQKKYKKNIKWIDLNLGEAILFSPNCLHGNVVNNEKNTRWSINVRYKNLFSPEGPINNEKRIGTFYKSFDVKGVTLFNLKHNFDEIIKTS